MRGDGCAGPDPPARRPFPDCATAGNVGASFQFMEHLTGGRNAARLARSLINRLHQILKVGKDVGVGFMAMLGYHFPIDDYVEFAVGSWG